MGHWIPGRRVHWKYASSWLPSSLSGLVCWLDADAITGKSDGASLSQWNDRSLLGNHAVQATAGLQPLYKTNIKNGLPAVQGDGTDDTMTISNIGANFSTQGSLFIVAGINSDTDYGIVKLDSVDSYWRWSGDGGGYFGPFRGTTRTTNNPASQPTTGTWLWSVISDASAYVIRKNGSQVTNTTTDFGVPTNATIFNQTTRYLNGWIMELCLFNRGLSATEIALVEEYLNRKWAVY